MLYIIALTTYGTEAGIRLQYFADGQAESISLSVALICVSRCIPNLLDILQKGGVPAAPSGTATLLRLSPSHQSYLRPLLAVTAFRHSRLPWLDGRCVQGPGTYSPRRG